MILENFLLNENPIKYFYENINDILLIIPELKETINFEHKHPHHHLNVINHTLLTLSLAPTNFTIRLILLLHDIGKPHCYYEKDGIRHFPNHGEVSSYIAKKILLRLNFSTEYIEIICKLIALHDTSITLKDIEDNYDFCYLLYQVQYCDALAHHPLKLDKRIAYLKNIKDNLTIKKLTR